MLLAYKKPAKKYGIKSKPLTLLTLLLLQLQKVESISIDKKQTKKFRDFLRIVLNEKEYTTSYALLSEKIGGNAADISRTFRFLCPDIDTAPLNLLFSYKELMNHLIDYATIIQNEIASPERSRYVEKLIEKDFRDAKMGLERFVARRERSFWKRDIDWNSDVILPVPTKIFKKLEHDESELRNCRELNYGELINNNPYLIQNENNELIEISIPVRVTEPKKPTLDLFTLRIHPKEKDNQNLVQIFLHLPTYGKRPVRSQQIPLHIIPDQTRGISVYSTTKESNVYSKVSRWYLYSSLNEQGLTKVENLKKELEDTQRKFPNLSDDKRKEYYSKINNAKNKPQYQNITVKTRGLLLYSLIEDDVIQFNKAVENLSKYNNQDEQEEGKSNSYFDKTITVTDEYVTPNGVITKTTELTLNELLYDNGSKRGTKSDTSTSSSRDNASDRNDFENNANELRMLDFPFLYRYHEFKHILPENFASDLMKRLASELIGVIESIASSELKYRVTLSFYEEVKSYFWKPTHFPLPRIYSVNYSEFESLTDYHYKVGSYIKFIERSKLEMSNWDWQQEINKNMQDLLERRFISKIDSNDSVDNPIISIIEERDNPVNNSYLNHMLTQIKSMYKEEYVITTSCFIAKWKADKLRQMLVSSGLPISLDKAKILFMNQGGMPEACMSGYCDIFKELGFNIRLKAGESSKVFYVFDSAAEDDRNNRVNGSGH